MAPVYLNISPAAGLATTASDMARFLLAHLGGTPGGEATLRNLEERVLLKVAGGTTENTQGAINGDNDTCLCPTDRWGVQGARQVGTLRQYSPTLVLALHLAECLVRSPAALAALLEAAGPLAQERVGQILARRPASRRPDPALSPRLPLPASPPGDRLLFFPARAASPPRRLGGLSTAPIPRYARDDRVIARDGR
jgi:hypothetical protein